MRNAFLVLALACAARAAVTLPYILADHMVVQRGLPVHVWGKADPGEKVTVTFRGETQAANADTDGRWSVYLKPGGAGGPFQLTVNTKTLTDVMVGDVWIAAGQSNMEWPVDWSARAGEEKAAANYRDIRLVRAMHKVSEFPVDNLIGQMWARCNAQTVAPFSAVGYYFGRELHRRLRVPVGLIQTAWGGTPLDAWTSTGAISADASLMPVFAEWSRMMRDYAAALPRYQRESREWEMAAARAKAAGRPAPERPTPLKGPGGHWSPGGLYNAMVAPLTNYPIRGVIWYQGESNTASERAPYYGRLFQTMIRDWRRAWGQGDFPFLFVQLASYKTPPDAMWPELREAQRHALELANTAMAVTVDIGEPDSIHPKNKQEVGRRLSLAARALVYGERIEYSGPLFRQAVPQQNAVRVWFDHAAGLSAKGSRLRGFEVAGADGMYVPADAVIEGGTVVARSPRVTAPLMVRYGWADYPQCNLYNAEGLPASPFRSR